MTCSDCFIVLPWKLLGKCIRRVAGGEAALPLFQAMGRHLDVDKQMDSFYFTTGITHFGFLFLT